MWNNWINFLSEKALFQNPYCLFCSVRKSLFDAEQLFYLFSLKRFFSFTAVFENSSGSSFMKFTRALFYSTVDIFLQPVSGSSQSMLLSPLLSTEPFPTFICAASSRVDHPYSSRSSILDFITSLMCMNSQYLSRFLRHRLYVSLCFLLSNYAMAPKKLPFFDLNSALFNPVALVLRFWALPTFWSSR